MFKSVLCLTLLATCIIYVESNLEIVSDEELLQLIRSNELIVVLFTKKDCEQSHKYELELIGVREDLVDTLNAWVVKTVSSQLVRLYSPSQEPALVFFRHGVPLLYDGPISDELILHTFSNNKEPIVKELIDDNFEHLTQAATGATTGDWFVMFYTNDCVDCQRLQARWEAVGAQLKSRMNVARVNKGNDGAKSGRRFDVQEVPTFILFRQGKMYRYHIKKYDVPSFVSFAQDWYKNVKGERIPIPKSPFDDFTLMIAIYLKENPWLWQVGFVSFIIGAIGAFIIRRKKTKKTTEKTKKKAK